MMLASEVDEDDPWDQAEDPDNHDDETDARVP